NMQPIRPSLGSWLVFGLGTENQNLPGFVVLCPGKPVVGPQLWSNSFLPGIYQGTHIRNNVIDPDRIIRDVTSRHLPRRAQRPPAVRLEKAGRGRVMTRARGPPWPTDAAHVSLLASLEWAGCMRVEARVGDVLAVHWWDAHPPCCDGVVDRRTPLGRREVSAF